MSSLNGKALLSLLSIYIVWGTTYLVIRIGVEDLPPVLFAGLRWLVAGSIFYVLMRLKKYTLPTRNDILHLSISGLLMLGVGNGLVVYAEQVIPSGLTALILTTTPFWMVGIESLLPHGKKLNVNIIVGLFLGLIGVSLIFGGGIKNLFNTEYLLGIVGLIVAEIGWVCGTLYSKYKKVTTQPLMGAAVQMIAAGIVLTAIGLVIGEASVFTFTINSFWAYSYLVLIGSLVGYASYMYAIAHLPVSLVSTYAYVNPIIALFLGWLILSEEITAWVFIASVVILFGVMIVKKGSEKQLVKS